MCGILAASGNVDTREFKKGLDALSPRGPDASDIKSMGSCIMGFTRLSVNGDSDGMQPFCHNNKMLICNGEIFNHKCIEDEIGYTPSSGSDCEVLVHASDRWQFSTLCNKLDAEFAMVLYDHNTRSMLIARDPYGVRPLFWGITSNGTYMFSSELKGIYKMCNTVSQFNPGWFMAIENDTMVGYHQYKPPMIPLSISSSEPEKRVFDLLTAAVEKRLMCGNGGVCFLLSGGLDSSLVCGIASQMSRVPIYTFSIGLEGSPDNEYARAVSKDIGSIHTAISPTEEEFLEVIPRVICAIESYDVTTVRASVGNYLVAKYIKEHTKFKVVLNGDYADEVCGGYLYTKLAPTDLAFKNECKRLVDNIHYYDSLRSDRCICAHGLEARAPYADKDFLEYYMMLPKEVSSPKGKQEKYLLRKSFSGKNIIPEKVIWRRKEAFSDGVSSTQRSWYEIIQDKHSSEEEYYKSIFDGIYGAKYRSIIPEKWMPRFCDATDPSARTLEIYN